jgi:hypothetical protein
MAIVVQNSKTELLNDQSYALASGQDFRGNVGFAVAYTSSVTTGEATVTACTATGQRIAGILKNNDAYPSGASTILENRAKVCKLGICMARSNASFAAGAELMVADTYGRLGTATGSAYYVVAVAREAATAADQMVAVEVFATPYYKA